MVIVSSRYAVSYFIGHNKMLFHCYQYKTMAKSKRCRVHKNNEDKLV